MASTINASTSPAAIIQTADGTANLSLQSNGTTIAALTSTGMAVTGTLSASGAATLSSTLAVTGEATFANDVKLSGDAYVYSANGGGVRAGWFLDGTNQVVRAYTAATERMRIDSSGNVVFNNAVSTLPWVAGSGAAYGLRIGTTYTLSVNNSDIVCIFNRTTSTGTLIEMKYNAGVVGSISVTGSATAYNTSSDYRLKENIAPMTGALDTITQLKPVTYKWKFDGSDGQGFIAHELAEVVPDCVSGEKDAVDEDGNIKPQGIDTSFLVATLTAAIQEQQALITSLTARITALEGA
jgi:Chaperone of endosialidase